MLCVGRGIFKQYVWKTGSFLEGFAYPFVLCLIITLISLPMYVLNKKYRPKEENANEMIDDMKYPTLRQSGIRLLVLVPALALLIFGIPLLIENFWFDIIMKTNDYYVISTDLFLFYIFIGLAILIVFTWLFSRGPVLGMKCHVPKKKKIKIAITYGILFMLSIGSLMTWYEAIVPDGVRVHHFLVNRSYTWDDVEYYELKPSGDGTLRYTLVLKDKTRADLIGGSMGFSNLSEEKYPDYEESLGLELAEMFKNMNVPIRADWKNLNKKLDYEYWGEYAEKIREVAE